MIISLVVLDANIRKSACRDRLRMSASDHQCSLAISVCNHLARSLVIGTFGRRTGFDHEEKAT
jgi:hypothetical protein